ncbi:MAG: SpaH/EbpB family LPXTG-anchored major pilin [Cellulomonadaceae bacterium]|jgi:fimbrial isopeptide formation D2 family protein|nr:SpaH/EbpB family LPXTG-anchored major pilin [Cellulomonadaceae bacterium]
MKRTRTRGAKIAVALAIVSALGLSVLAPLASADPLVDPTLTGTLVVTKYKATGTVSNSTGAQATPAPTNAPLGGVEFTVSRVESWEGGAIDLSTEAGWNTAADLAAAFDATSGTLPGDAVLATTAPALQVGTTDGATGVVSFLSLPLGLYYVQENNTPAGVVPSIPFLVTLPMTSPDGSGWMVERDGDGNATNYIVYTYPKNDVVTLNKTVNANAAITAGGTLTYTVTGAIPVNEDPDGNAEPITGYVITDTLDSALSTNRDNVAVSIVAGDGTTTPLTPDDYVIDVTGKTVTVTLSVDGRNKLKALAQETLDDHLDLGYYQVQVTIAATVASTYAGGTLTNTATLFPDQAAVNSGTGLNSNTVTTYYGGVVITKTDDSQAPLAGAQFQVFASETNASAVSNPLSALPATGAATDTFTSAADGTVVIQGLLYNPASTNESHDTTTYGPSCTTTPNDGTAARTGTQYWVVETQAPTGYELQTDPIAVCIVAALVSPNGDDLTSTPSDITVINYPHNAGFELPATGEMASRILLICGVVAILGAVSFYVIRTKRTQAQAAAK